MKVLITGGYGFIGSHIADRFYREGYSVYIIDNLSRGNVNNFIHKHRSYELDVEDAKCEEIFKSNDFDVVIHAAAQADERQTLNNTYNDAKTNLLGLINMLSLSARYKVKKFIFASTTSVYGECEAGLLDEESSKKPLSFLAFNKLSAESYCAIYRKMFGLETIVLRMSNIYGPRQNHKNGGVIAKFIENTVSEKNLVIYGDGEQTRDFLYVEDVADAFYKAANINYSGEFNLCSGVSISINQIAKLVGTNGASVERQYEQMIPNEIKHAMLDNSKIKRIFDWIPLTSLEDGIAKTYSYNTRTKANIVERKEELKEKVKKVGKWASDVFARINERRWMPYIENFIAYFVLTLFTIRHLGVFRHFPVDFKLLLIIVFSIMYGSRQGIVSFILSFISTIIVFKATARDPVVLIYSADFYWTLAYYIFVAFIIGYVRDALVRANRDSKETMNVLDEKIEFATSLYHDMRTVRDELQSQIMQSEDSFGKIFSIVQELDTLKPEEVFAKAITVLERLMKTDGVAIYRFSEASKYARLMACSPQLNSKIAKSINIEERKEMISVTVNRDLYVASEIKDNEPIMAIPVLDRNDIVGIILIYNMQFERLTLSYQNYFRVITNLISSTLSKAYDYDKAVENDRYIVGTNIFNSEAFNEMLRSKKQLKKENQLSFVCLKVSLIGISQKSAADKITSVIRDTDFMGMGNGNELLVVLSNTTREEASFVIGRLFKLGVNVELLDEEEDESDE